MSWGHTEPEEAKGPYQDHFLLVLCENLATSAVVGDDARTVYWGHLLLFHTSRWRREEIYQERGARDNGLTTPSENQLPGLRPKFEPG